VTLSSEHTVMDIQQWNPWIPGCLVAAAVVLNFAPVTVAAIVPVSSIYIESAGAALFVIVVIGIVSLRASRCRHCNYNLLLYAWRHKSAGGWLIWLKNVESCPDCGYTHRRDGFIPKQ
jgi:hypothetical protein